MEFLMLYLCGLILGFPTARSVPNKDEIIFNYNNTYKYNVAYTVNVNKRMEYIMEFGGGMEAYDTPARVTVASDIANQTFPLFITARQQKGVFSWQLPMLVQTPLSVEKFTNISRTLCPHNNLFSDDADTCVSGKWMNDYCDPVIHLSSLNTPIIHLTSSSLEDIKVTIVVETVQDFYIKMNMETNLTSTPSQPKYYFYPFEQSQQRAIDLPARTAKRKRMCHEELNEDEQSKLNSYMLRSSLQDDSWLSRPKSVIVMIESPDDICAVVSIQNFSCPVFDNERDILYDGYYLTMTRRGGITLTQDTFPVGFYIVFIVKTSDDDCTDVRGGNSSLPKVAHYLGWGGEGVVNVPTSDGRVKQFSFKIIETISYKEYLIGAGATLAFFVSFYVAFVVVILLVRRDPGPYEDLVANSEEGNATPVLRDSATVRRRRVADARAGDVTASQKTDGYATPEAEASSTSRRRAAPEASGSGDADLTASTQRAGHFGSSSSSDTESDSLEDDIEKDPYRLGGRLCVANLARCRPRVLSARSKMYLWNVLTVAVFYTLPVVQLVVTYQRLLNQSGNQDLCYFNFLCAHPLMVLSDFNHVYSNLGYVLLGLLFLLQVWRRQQRQCLGRQLGIPQHFGLLYAMGVALVSEGLLSAAYHVCPNSMNFQFDTSFMYVTSVLCMVKIYQSRHPDINARAHATFGVLALIIFFGLVGVLNANFYFWVLFTVIHLGTCLLMTFQIYYLGRFRLDWNVIYRAVRELVYRPLAAITPTYCGRCVLLAIANLSNWAIAAYGVSQHSRDFASHLLLVLMSNLFLYTLFYIVMKLLHRETIRWYSWVFITLTYSVWFGSSYFYFDQSTNWALTPAQSRQNNRVCSFLELYDSHDMWHLLSSCAMFFSFNMYLTIDDNLARVPRDNIMVF